MERPSRHPSVSVVVPCEPDAWPNEALGALALLSARERASVAEVFVSQGRNPGRQRNLAAARARGDWLWFLDRDSRPERGSLTALLEAGRSGDAAAVGGPDLPLPGEGGMGPRFDAVLGSWFGSMASRARYLAVGARRPCSEKELIGCNLLLRRDMFVRVGGFREDLYPNEENELLERVRGAGGALWYEPQGAVRRGRPQDLRSFAAKAFAYGRGRARQARLAWTRAGLLNFLPLLLPLAWAATGLALVLAPRSGGLVLGAFWAAYACSALGASAWSRAPLQDALFWALRHHAYAWGLLAGLLTPLPAFPQAVRLSRAPWRGGRFKKALKAAGKPQDELEVKKK